MYKFISWTAVILLMALTFYLSHQPATTSNQLSTGITEAIVEIVERTTPNAEIDVRDLNRFVRKNAHFFIYLMIGMILLNALRRSRLKGYSVLVTLLFSMMFAIMDELHQLFVPGRGAQFEDVLIDVAGASVGIGIYFVFGRLMKILNIR
ncbi:VanZ family protein [Bacillus sp. DJP31]|uniref:VanZ family protein n=1 Tax=Bacillus sp. DJP31 TaxID=3409789 RepID=UPI003BB4D7BD